MIVFQTKILLVLVFDLTERKIVENVKNGPQDLRGKIKI